MTDWRFNAWAKYDNWRADDQVPSRINKRLRLKRWQPTCNGKRVVLEGGSIDVNGAGLLLTTEECLLSPVQARNPHLTKTALEQVLCDNLDIKKVLWLESGIAGDDTHGHIDDLTRFVGPRTVVTAIEENRADPNFAPLQGNLQRLKEMTDVAGQSLEIVNLPMPAPLFFNGQRLPVSYANFYIGNDKVLVPTFNDPRDCQALGILADLFRERTVVGIHAVDLVWGLGTLHCMTQQQPKGSSELP
jgi:agmatine deiminase